MKKNLITTGNAILMLVIFLSGMASTASPAYAQDWNTPYYNAKTAGPSSIFETQKWNDRSDELPGLVSGKSILAIAAVGAGVITTAFVFRSRKNKRKKEEEARQRADQSESTASLSSEYDYRSIYGDEQKSLQERLLETRRQVPVNLILDLSNQIPGTSDKAIRMGLSVTF